MKYELYSFMTWKRIDQPMTNETRKKLFSFYPYCIAFFVVLLCLAVWPLQLLGHTSYESASLERGIFPNLNLSDGSVPAGEFTPAHRQLDSISFRFLISGQAPDGTVTLELHSGPQQQKQKICSVELESGDIMNYRWIDFPLDLELEPDATYTWQLRAADYEEASLALYSGSPVIGPNEAGPFYYNDIPEEKHMPAVIYTYSDQIDAERCLPYYAAFLLFGLLLFTMCRKFEKYTEDV